MRLLYSVFLICCAGLTQGCGLLLLSALADDDEDPASGQETRVTPSGVAPADQLLNNLRMVKADEAYYAGLTGEGIEVVVVDTGLTDSSHEALPRSAASTISGRYRGADEAEFHSHGTTVTGVIAARPHSGGRYRVDDQIQQVQGVAPQAMVRMISINLGTGTGPYRPISVSGLVGISSFQALFDAARQTVPGAIVNLSFGFSGGIDRAMYSERDLRTVLNFAPSGNQTILSQLMQQGVPEDEKIVYVWAAGNARARTGSGALPVDFASPEVLAGLPAKIPELQGNWLAVVAVNPTVPFSSLSSRTVAELGFSYTQPGGLAFFSNACGSASDFCLAAPGACVPTTAAPGIDATGAASHFPQSSSFCDLLPRLPEGYAYVNGTSFAAPTVTGALALMQQQFRGTMTGAQLVSRVLATADKTNYDLADDNTANNSQADYSNEAIYGQGLLDIGSAISPAGALRLPLPAGLQSLSGSGQAVSSQSTASVLHASVVGQLAGSELMLLDEMGFPFWVQADAMLGGVGQSPEVLQLSAAPSAWLLGNAHSQRSLFASVGTSALSLLSGSFTAGNEAQPSWLKLLGAQSLHTGVRMPAAYGQLTALWSLARPAYASDVADTEQRGGQMLATQYQLRSGSTDWSLLSGVVEEKGRLLGLDAAVLRAAALRTRTQFAAVSMRHSWGQRWQLDAGLHWSRSSLSLPAGGLLVGGSSLAGRYAQFSLSRRLSARDRLSWSLERKQDLSSGQLHWQLPTTLSAGEVQYRRLYSAVAQPARDVASLGYSRALGRRGAMGFEWRHGDLSVGPAAQRRASSLNMRWRWDF